MAEAARALDPGSPAVADERAWATAGWSGTALRQAIINTLIYADLFEYPLTVAEIQRYLVGERAPGAAVTATIDADPVIHRLIERSGGWISLAGRGHLPALRRERALASARLWPLARRYGAIIARLPFVRLVGVTGALAMDNAVAGDDIDLFILVQPGRLWFCRLSVVAMVRLAARNGTNLCPNFLLTTDHLRLSEQNLFTAHEVCQMVPLSATPWHHAFLAANDWVRRFLPNALPRASAPKAAVSSGFAGRLLTRALSHRLFDPIERWEMHRKVRRLSARHEREGGSVRFSADECRGHFAAHDARILVAYEQRVALFREALS